MTIRAYAAQDKIADQMSSKTSQEPTKTERTAHFGQASSAHTLNTKLAPQSTVKKQVSKMYDYLVKFQEHR